MRGVRVDPERRETRLLKLAYSICRRTHDRYRMRRWPAFKQD